MMTLSSDRDFTRFLQTRRIETLWRELPNPTYLQRKLFYALPGGWRTHQERLRLQQEREAS